MTAFFIVRAKVADAALRQAFDRVWGDEVTRSRDIVQVIQAIGSAN